MFSGRSEEGLRVLTRESLNALVEPVTLMVSDDRFNQYYCQGSSILTSNSNSSDIQLVTYVGGTECTSTGIGYDPRTDRMVVAFSNARGVLLNVTRDEYYAIGSSDNSGTFIEASERVSKASLFALGPSGIGPTDFGASELTVELTGVVNYE